MKKTFTKVLSVLLVFAMLFGALPSAVFAGDESTSVYVTLSKHGSFVEDKNGSSVVKEEVELSGKIEYTLDDVFKAFHEQYYDGAEGYSSAIGEYGKYIAKLWGDESLNYGYYVDGAMANSLDDKVKAGSHVEAFIYQSSWPNTESYAKFDVTEKTVKLGESLELVLSYVSGYDVENNYAPIFSALEGATVTANGKNAGTTDSEGKVTLSFSQAGEYVVSAAKTKTVGEDEVAAITAPVCIVSVEPEEIEVTVWAQNSNVFLLMPQKIKVASDAAEKYGFDDTVAGVSALDVLIRANEVFAEDIMGEKLTAENLSDYISGKPTNIRKAFRIESGLSFAINGEYPYDPSIPYNNGYTGYNINQAPVNAGDEVEFFFYQDSYYMDYYVWFEKDGTRVKELSLYENEGVELALHGLMYAYGGYLNEEDRIKQGTLEYLEDAQLAIIGASGELNVIDNAMTDENGKVTLKLDKEGTYYISALLDSEETYDYIISPNYIISPILKVNVSGYGVDGLSISAVNNLTSYDSMLLNGTTDENVPEEIPVSKEGVYEYDLPDVTDVRTGLYFWYTTPKEGSKVEFSWKNLSTGKTGSRVLNKETDKGISFAAKNLYSCLSGGKNEITMTVTPPAGTNAEPKSYVFNINALPTLSGLTATADGSAVYLDKVFAKAETNYVLTVPKDAKELVLNAEPASTGYKVMYNGLESSTIKLDGLDEVKITVSVGEGETLVSNTYAVKIKKVEGYSFKPVLKTPGSVLMVYDSEGIIISPDEDGCYVGMFADQTYTYTVSKYGYVGVKEEIKISDLHPEVTLEKAPESTHAEVNAQWKNFRNSDVNMGITSAETPVNAEYTALLWNKKLGSGWSAAPSVQIIADDALVVMTGQKKIYKLDLETGDVLCENDMEQAPSYGYTPPIYAEGLIICPLGNGTIQAFDAKTLESVWVYRDNIRQEQALSPITYSDGYIYTGFWTKEAGDAHFVCISVTDEDPEATNEEKTAVWKHRQLGGFYWAGSVVVGDYVLVGTDDGTNESGGTSYIYSFNKYTGEAVSKTALVGAEDQRSSLAYDEATGRIYFTTKAGYLFRADVDAKTGKVSNLKSNKCVENAQSTSTPVVYKGIVYFGVGAGFSGGDACRFVAADADSLEMVGSVKLLGYPQCSMLLTTAYEDEGYLYFYSTYNTTPGGISLIKVKNDPKSSEDMELTELYDAAGFSQYCISSMICDNEGSLYYKNDSGNILKVGIPDTKNVEKLIDSIGDPVTLEDETTIDSARKAYEALSDEAKEGFDQDRLKKLEEAEKALSDLKVKEAERLINEIPDEVTLKDERTIGTARDYYNNHLTDEERARVSNYEKLTKAESALQKLKDSQPGGGTKKVTVTINGITYEVSEATKKAVEAMQAVTDPKDPKDKLPEDFADLTPAQERSILVAARLYNALTPDEKLFATNYADFEKNVLKKLGECYHYDVPTETDARDNTEEALPWYVKLEVKETEPTDKQLEQLKKVLGENAKLITLYKISFKDMLTSKEWKPESLINVKYKTLDKGELDTYCAVHIDEDGNMQFIKGELSGSDGTLKVQAQSFAQEGIAAFEGSWESIFGAKDETTSSGKVWPWATAGGVSVAGLLALILGKKKKKEEE